MSSQQELISEYLDRESNQWQRLYYDRVHQLYCWNKYENDQWVFLDWAPQGWTPSGPAQTPTGHRPNASVTGQPASASHTFSKPGSEIRGTYSTANPNPREALDPSYIVRLGDFFREGTVFMVLFAEPAGDKIRNRNSLMSHIKYADNIYAGVRRFVSVRNKRGFCYACPIYTYSNRGTTKPGIRADEHAIVYSEGYSPVAINGEQQLSKEPICVAMNHGEQPLVGASRINFGIHHAIQHNVKVKHLGHVRDDQIAKMRGYWKMENVDDDIPTNNPAEASADALENEMVVDIHVYDAESNPHGYHAQEKPYAYHPFANPYGWHPKHNPFGHHPDYTPNCYHQVFNLHGYNQTGNPFGWHPDANPGGFHPEAAPNGFHPEHNRKGFHPKHNKAAFHPQFNPRVYDKKYNGFFFDREKNPKGYHPEKHPTAFHPVFNQHAYHAEANPHGYHARKGPYAFHPDLNPCGFHHIHNPTGHHPHYNPDAYHPHWKPDGAVGHIAPYLRPDTEDITTGINSLEMEDSD